TLPRLTSLSRNANLVLRKPRLGRRRCSGIWPPSKPLIRTPERAGWPLPPRPACLPLPEPMPRPTRIRFLREPGLSARSVSFIVLLPLLPVHNADEMLHLVDHAANFRRILKLGDTADLVELQTD